MQTFLLNVIYKWIPLEFFQRTKKIFTIVYPRVFWLFNFDHFFEGFNCFFFIFCFHCFYYSDKQSTATKRYWTLRLYFDSLSTWAKSSYQILLKSFTKTLSHGDINRINPYAVKEVSVSQKECTLPKGSFLWACKRFTLVSGTGPFK